MDKEFRVSMKILIFYFIFGYFYVSWEKLRIYILMVIQEGEWFFLIFFEKFLRMYFV